MVPNCAKHLISLKVIKKLGENYLVAVLFQPIVSKYTYELQYFDRFTKIWRRHKITCLSIGLCLIDFRRLPGRLETKAPFLCRVLDVAKES